MPTLILAENPSDDIIPVQVDTDGILKVDATAQGDVPITLDSEIVTIESRDDVLEATLSLDTSAYADGDVLAATQSLDGDAFTENGGTAILQSIQVIDLDDQAKALDIVLLRSDTSIGSENSAVSVSDANADEILAIIPVTTADYVDLVNSQIAEIANIGKLIKAAAANDGLWIAAISRGTGTYTASGIKVRVGLLR